MLRLSFFCLLLAASASAWGAIPELTISRTGRLFLLASDLTTNGVPGLSNAAARAVVSGVPGISAHGGQISIVHTQVWTRLHNLLPNSLASAIAVGRDGQVSVADFGGSVGAFFNVAQFDAHGTLLWTNSFHIPGRSDAAYRVALDHVGNTIVAGESDAGFFAHLRDIVTIKYSPVGQPLWTNVYNETGTNYHQIVGMAADRSGNVFVALNTFGPAPGKFTTIKYDSSGAPLWTNRHRFSASSSDYMSALAVNDAGYSVVTGGDLLTFMYSPDGTAVWTNRLNGNGVSIAFDRQGQTLVCGDVFGGVPFEHGYATLKIASNGTVLWTNYISAPQFQGGHYPYVLADGANNVFVLGGSPGISNLTDLDVTLTRLTSDGAPVWSKRFFRAQSDASPPGASVDAAGNVSFTAGVAMPNEDNDFLTVRYTSQGALSGSNQFNAALLSRDYPGCLAIGESGHVYVAGGSDHGLVLIKYADHIAYTPPPNFVGTDSFTFVAIDRSGLSATNTVHINVIADALWLNPLKSNLGSGSTRLLHMDGAISNKPVILHRSFDLDTWTPLATNIPASSSVQFIVPANTPSHQFFRGEQ